MYSRLKPFKGRTVNLDKEVDFYRCLNRKGFVFSIRQDGLVVAHTDKVVLKDCKLIVNKSGKERCLKTKTRNVHAFVRGKIGDIYDIKNEFSFILKYNPYEDLGFHVNLLKDKIEIGECKSAYIQGNSVMCQI